MTLTVTRPAEKSRALPPSARPARRRSRREARVALLFLAPDVLGLTVFLVRWRSRCSLFAVDGFGNYSFVGLDNFQRMAEDPCCTRV